MAMFSPANKLAAWFAVHWDGTARDYETDMGQAARELYHPNIELVTSQGTVDLEGITSSNKLNVRRGLKCNIRRIEVLDDTHVEYIVELFYQDNGENFMLHSIGTFTDGKLIRVEPFNKEEYGKSLKPAGKK